MLVSSSPASASCTSEPKPTGFESPSAAIDSLFRAYGVQDISQEEARRRLQGRERFELLDESLFKSCFSDWQGEHDHALGGFVFGQLVAAKDELEDRRRGGSARVRAASASPELQPIVLVEQRRGVEDRSPAERSAASSAEPLRSVSAGDAGLNGKLAERRRQWMVNGVTSIGSPGGAVFSASCIIRSSRACGLSARPAATVRSAALVSPTPAKYRESA